MNLLIFYCCVGTLFNIIKGKVFIGYGCITLGKVESEIYELIKKIAKYDLAVMGYPYKLKVGDIGTESAVLMWRTTDSNVEEFEVRLFYKSSA